MSKLAAFPEAPASATLKIAPQFEDASPFSEGLAVVEIGGRAGYIDKNGKYVINPQFEPSFWNYDYLLPMFDGDKQYYIDKSEIPAGDLARIKAKVMMLHGRQDVSFPPEHTCMVLARSLDADVWLINNCAHSVALEYPEKFLAAEEAGG